MSESRPTSGRHAGPERRSTADWLTADRTDLAMQRILDVAEELFVTEGVAAVTMRGLADAVGCSRATLYRYYPGKAEVLAAYIDRSARVLASSIVQSENVTADRGTRLVDAIMTAVTGVRDHPALAAWFVPEAAGDAANLAMLSPAIESIATDFLRTVDVEGETEASRADRARWLVRVILSLLTGPGGSPAEERAMLERFVVPVVLPVEPS